MKYLRLLSFLIVILSAAHGVHAQYEPTSGVSNYLQFNHLKENVGIENMVVNHVYEDNDGYT